MFCTTCGNTLKEDAKFCTSCGTETKKPVVKPVSQPTTTIQKPVVVAAKTFQPVKQVKEKPVLTEEQKLKRKKTLKWVIVSLVIVFALSGLGIGGWYIYQLKTALTFQKISDEFTLGNYNEVTKMIYINRELEKEGKSKLADEEKIKLFGLANAIAAIKDSLPRLKNEIVGIKGDSYSDFEKFESIIFRSDVLIGNNKPVNDVYPGTTRTLGSFRDSVNILYLQAKVRFKEANPEEVQPVEQTTSTYNEVTHTTSNENLPPAPNLNSDFATQLKTLSSGEYTYKQKEPLKIKMQAKFESDVTIVTISRNNIDVDHMNAKDFLAHVAITRKMYAIINKTENSSGRITALKVTPNN